LSPKLCEIVCLLAQQAPFEVAGDILERIIGIRPGTSTIKETAESIGAHLFEEELAQSSTSDVNDLLNMEMVPETLENRVYLEMDGAMVNSVDGWKENKLGIIFSEDDIVTRGEGENERLSIQKKTLVSSFASGVDDFEKRIKHWLIKSGKYFHNEIIAISDGAVWIENIIERLLPRCTHILDWFHVKERLWKCAKEVHGDKSPKCKPWVDHYADLLWEGKTEQALSELWKTAMKAKNQTPILEVHQYFNVRKPKMRYDIFRKKGYYIGSGAVESANKYVIQDRLKKAGMRWSIFGANAIAKLRTLYLSGLWESAWEAAPI